MAKDGITRRAAFSGVAAGVLPFVPEMSRADPAAAVDHVATSLAQLKAMTISTGAVIYDHAPFQWTAGNFTGQADDINVVASTNTPLSSGAWLRQSAQSLTFKQESDDAVTRPVLAKLQERISVDDFGMIPNDPAKAATNFAAIRKALRYVLSRAPAPHLERNVELVFGPGEYFIAGNSPLMFNRTEMVALPGSYRYRRGIRFTGQGRNATILTLVSGGTQDRWFYSTQDPNYPGADGDTSVADYMHFEGLTFRGTVSSQAQPKGSETNGFYLKSRGWEKFITWSNCLFEHLDKVIAVEGYGNVDHNRLYGCSFYEIRDYLIRFNNNQAVAWGFYGCDAELIRGRVIEIGPQGGGDLIWIGGSIMLYPEVSKNGSPLARQRQKAMVHWDNSGTTAGPSSGPGNAKFTFKQLRFELYSTSQAFVHSVRADDLPYGNIEVTFEDCDMPMAFSTPGAETNAPPFPAVKLQNRAIVRFVRCTLNRAFQYVCEKHNSVISFDDCIYLNEVPITDTNLLAGKCSIQGGTGTVRARGTIAQVNVRAGDFSTIIVADFNKGVQALPNPVFSAQGKDARRGWPQPQGIEPFRTYFAEGTIVQGILINKPAEKLTGAADSYRLEVADPAGNRLFTTQVYAQGDEILERETFSSGKRKPYRVPAAPNNYLVVAASGANVARLLTRTDGTVIFELA